MFIIWLCTKLNMITFKNLHVIYFYFLLFILCSREGKSETTPVVLWHGMGDSCCNPLSMGYIEKLIKTNLNPPPYVKSIQIGLNFIEDINNSFFMNINEQVDTVCKELAADTNLTNGYNAVGFSQGGQFLRAVVQRCFNPPVENLITIGSQHQGVFGYPRCLFTNNKFCQFLAELLNRGAYYKWVQNNFVQAEYWHDPIHEDKYRYGSVFLADINNELKINYLYRQHVTFLKNFVMVKFEDDTMVIPKETEWFGYFTSGQDINVTSLRDSALYKEDKLGLQYLDLNGRLHFLSVAGDHLQISDKWFVENIIQKFLSGVK